MAIQSHIKTWSASRLVSALVVVAGALLSNVPAHAATGLGRTQAAPPQAVNTKATPHHEQDRERDFGRTSTRHDDEGRQGHHDQEDTWGGRGRPTSVRPDHPHYPPHPVVVVPPCKRGGPGITPC